MSVSDAPPPGAGPDETAARILESVLDELAERGLDGVSTDAIARRARVSKTSVYTRWRTKRDLVVAAYHHAAAGFPEIATGSLAGDIDRLWQVYAAGAGNHRYLASLAQLVGGAVTDPRLREELHAVQRAWRDGIHGLLTDAQARGELDADVDVELLAEVVQSLALTRAVISDLPATDDTLRRSIERLIFDSPPRIR